ncbi:PucR family transcriptional regulator [Rhodococcus chondri]|uniref:Helix-turn-helix domain-containing protein n=1 Tax=Rhodococcus chondri TaxID=3065941 RepID=A0ABU7JXC1_9NOCA|nr:helix-turn-helix domain-containing protein [Rhodococcus sp. CC-R104]MEE2034670.1 helix-turn-helix domain-containing protein [Rhodococcus sp. CC-R104]
MSDESTRRTAAEDASAERVQALVVLVGDRLQRRYGEVTASMNAAIESTIEDLDAPELADMLGASVEGNVATILHMIRNSIPLERVQPTTAATEYAIRLARRDVPAAALRRAYHIGSDDLLNQMFEEIQQLECAPDLKLKLLHYLAGWMHKYVDWITRAVLDAHEKERLALLQQTEDVTSTLVEQVLGGGPANPEEFGAKTGYRLDGTHLGAVVWTQGPHQGADQTHALAAVAETLAAAGGAGARPLFVPVDRRTAWVWTAMPPRGTGVDLPRLRSFVQATPGLRVALGKPGSGVGGFRRTHEQAEALRTVASSAAAPHSRVVFYGDDGMAVTAVLARDIASTRRWVADVLGPLAADTPAAERLRETVRVFLRTGGSYVQTSEELVLHRNTVKYRLQKAEEERGRPFTDNRLDVELALHVCCVLGRPVLLPKTVRPSG